MLFRHRKCKDRRIKFLAKFLKKHKLRLDQSFYVGGFFKDPTSGLAVEVMVSDDRNLSTSYNSVFDDAFFEEVDPDVIRRDCKVGIFKDLADDHFEFECMVDRYEGRYCVVKATKRYEHHTVTLMAEGLTSDIFQGFP